MILIQDATINNKVQDILIEKNKIKKIGKNLIQKENLNRKDLKIIDGKNKIIIPGLVNTHTHTPMTLFRGVADDLPLMDWLNNYIWKMEANLNEKIVYDATMLGCMEMIKSGTTTFNDMYFYMNGIIKGVQETGIRAYLGYGMIDLFDEEKRENELKETVNTVENIQKLNNPKINPTVSPHAPYTCSMELLQESHNLAKKYNVPLHIHLNETIDEIKTVEEMTNKRPFEYLDSFGFFNGVKVISAHNVHLSNKEIEIIKNKNIAISHNPISNLKLASGIAPIPKLMENTVLITLGTDGCGSNNNLNLFEEIKMASLIHKGNSLNPTVVSASQSFEFATKNGANALGLNAGELVEGALADVVIIDINKPYLIPNENIYSHLVYSFNGVVDMVIIDGEIVLNNGKMVNINEEKVYENAEKSYNKLLNNSDE
ncbi:amidohydrolase [Methanococcus aeolicus Nankai-3]|uniref:5'-deoxyadenosine deaminase n=1 Tax=Methanococcus aeolicus (strain ATCC BAA-1280 / DSM 17508 / OCM 812 / Nankai-3) TaxID=419665 RepID=DADD_META3|nr:amidohydrolase [Methanococcus aeolicus]A6UUG9.1 RecName: Full=5'-deoxyadenosine deaminase; Short=5'-dA deaminase; AltName: Full=5'-methylthioadenosine deaminase; Short=MTA deaminase; AltName: Full=Adenosine deaminase; AltName: Full=S-adenosylhomocysteine deaminase; Short=SAH deaminase [Methanococcus aeolicus Nankai-3]ABR56141.1 amidohydrolase [Methanococcus aeolicus Nankai-3]